MTEPQTPADTPEPTVAVSMPDWLATRLSVLIDPDRGITDLAGVIGEILDHVQQGIYRPGSWERGWLCQAVGYDWTARMEPDPDSPPFERPRAPRPSAPPVFEHEAYGIRAAALEDISLSDGIVASGHIDPRRFVAACSKVARDEWSCWLSDVTRPGTVYAAVRHVWAVYTDDSTAEDWRLAWDGVTAETPGAFPVTVLVPDWPASADAGDER